MDELQFIRLKSLSEQRNIAKTLKRIDSPEQSRFKLFDPYGSVKPEITQTLSSIEEQLQNRSKSKTHRQDRRDSVANARKKGIPYSKIQLGITNTRGRHKENSVVMNIQKC